MAVGDRYLYGRLGSDKFQQLVQALLVFKFDGIQCLPVGQADGGRDAMQRTATGALIYQVKWSEKRVSNPVTWLSAAVKDEGDNIRRLVAEGAKRYIIVTNLKGSSAATNGEIDKVEQALAVHAAAFGVPMDCWWRPELDALVDGAPTEIKWSYGDMLAGYDAFRFLLEQQHENQRDKELRELLLGFAGTQFVEDSKVKFRQTELHRHELADLFIDLPCVQEPGVQPRLRARLGSPGDQAHPAAASLLLREQHPATLIRGEPGQGKSTLAQLLCQIHRAGFLRDVRVPPELASKMNAPHARWPVRADLRDYGAWLSGENPFASDAKPAKKRPRPRNGNLFVEAFLADLISARSGGPVANAATVREILHRLPTLIVLDGLDEVADPKLRDRIVLEIDALSGRLKSAVVPAQLIVTTRPNASGLPEPSVGEFQVLRLGKLDDKLRASYLRKWAAAMELPAPERRELERNFRSRSVEPHIAELADNPMQLTILLYLMNKRGDSVPTKRTDLYRSFMETFLDREQDKTPEIKDYRSDLEEITAFLGWSLQAKAESDASNGQLPVPALKTLMYSHLVQSEKKTDLVDVLFKSVTDRVWVLTSKVQGTFEFDVQPVREYFAAHYLHHFAGTGSAADKGTMLRELSRRPYWENTGRFFGGFATTNELAGLRDALQEELAEQRRPLQMALATWRLLGDGVFAARPAIQRQVAAALADPLLVRLLDDALARGVIAPLPADRGGEQFAEALLDTLENDPKALLAGTYGRVAATLVDRTTFDPRWVRSLRAATTPAEVRGLLNAGACAVAASRLPPDVMAALPLDIASADAAISAGLTPEPDSQTEQLLLRAVLDGHAVDAIPSRPGLVCDLLKILAPQHLLRRAADDGRAYQVGTQHPDSEPRQDARMGALDRLSKRDKRLAALRTSIKVTAGQAKTTSPWGNTARAITAVYGPTWLAIDLAVIGAALPSEKWRTGGDTDDGEPFGPNADHGALISRTRQQRSNPTWWTQQHVRHTGELSRAAWALALVAVADEQVINDCLTQLDSTVRALPPERLSPLLLSSSRLGASGLARRLTAGPLTDAADMSSAAALLLAHHTATLNGQDQLSALSDGRLAEMARFGAAGWPAHRALSARLTADPTPEGLEHVRTAGPDAVVNAGALPPDLAALVLDDAALFPLAWVLQAQTVRTQGDSSTTLEALALQDGWLTSG